MTDARAISIPQAPRDADPLPAGEQTSALIASEPPQEQQDMNPEQPLKASDGTGQTSASLRSISEALHELLRLSGRYHIRAEQRENVIEHLRDEVDRLRRGERRGLLRPLLTETCRLRNDLLRQAEGLPDHFGVEQARSLLRSYADSVELSLEENGVIVFVPDEGEPFDPRSHRRVGNEPIADPGLTGRVSRVRRCGYLDLETRTPIMPAEVVLFAATSATTGSDPPSAIPKPAPAGEAVADPTSADNEEGQS